MSFKIKDEDKQDENFSVHTVHNTYRIHTPFPGHLRRPGQPVGCQKCLKSCGPGYRQRQISVRPVEKPGE
jgi:hypothetical protein